MTAGNYLYKVCNGAKKNILPVNTHFQISGTAMAMFLDNMSVYTIIIFIGGYWRLFSDILGRK